MMESIRATSINDTPDGELVHATKCGDPNAFEALFLRHERKVFAVAQRILNNREDAEDIVQESFHKAFLHISAFQGKSLFSTWLTRIAMNEAFMLLRRRKRTFELSHESPDDDARSVTTAFVDQGPNPEQSCWHQERTKVLAEEINRLSPKLRSTILLYDIEEYSINETAQILGTSSAAVKSRLNHGREKLRGRMTPEYQFEVCTVARGEATC